MIRDFRPFILKYAKEMMQEHGVLPSDFFNQSLKDFLMVIAADEQREDVVISREETDESGF